MFHTYFYLVKNKNQFINLWFDRFLHIVMSERVAPDYMGLLSDADRRALVNKDEFILDASLEEKLMLLSKLGYPFALVVGAPQKILDKNKLVKLVRIFFRTLTWKRREATKVMQQRFFFASLTATSSRG